MQTILIWYTQFSLGKKLNKENYVDLFLNLINTLSN